MPDFTIREYTSSDVPEMIELWHVVFGDGYDYIGEFVRLLNRTGTALVAEYDGRIVGAEYLITGLELAVPGKKSVKCAYIYALGVYEEARCLGIGRSLMSRSISLAKELGADKIFCVPSGEGLFKWYRETSDFNYCTYLKYYETECGNALRAVKITPAEYLRKRTALFADKTRIDPSAAVAELLSCLCEKLGGGIFDCGDSVAAAYPDGDTAVLYEIAAPTVEAFPHAAAFVAAALGCARAKYRVPSEAGHKFISSYHPLPDDCFFGYSFD